MPLLDSADSAPVHFMGIAGAGMSALAELFVRRGATVTGCDANISTADDLRELGIKVVEGHSVSHVAGARAVVVTAAVPPRHVELEAARELGIPVLKRAQALGEAVAGGTVVGIAGTHGKTTTTVMTTEALRAAKREPTGIAGGRVAAWHGNMLFGSQTLFVVEADEYDRSFLALTPTVAVVTNVEADHLDIYRDLADVRGAFEQFVSPAKTIVLCADDKGANTLPVPSSAEIIRYGTGSNDARLCARKLNITGGRASFTAEFDGEALGVVELQVPGAHNVRNALAAIASGLALGVTVPEMAPGLAAFRGVERRFERVGEAKGVIIVDDYAHHPTEITATIDAARLTFPKRRLLVAFQPHLYTRTRDFADAFGHALSAADLVFLTEIYPAREKPIPGVSADLIARTLLGVGKPKLWRGVRDDLADALAQTAREGDVVLTLGAGDITHTGPELLRMLEGRA